MITVAALFVEKNGVYYGIPEVDPWDRSRDARLYSGPFPVVAHPPCARWGRYWSGGPSARIKRIKGDDEGCFAAALAAVRRWGGVLEHPAASAAWRHFGLLAPPHSGGWVVADWEGGWTCCVAQGHYGFRARKATWLYAAQITDLPSLCWGPLPHTHQRLDARSHSAAERRRAIKTGQCEHLSARQRAATPLAFRDVLLAMARSVDTDCCAMGQDQRVHARVTHEDVL
jgi:hypothetical protein